MARSPLIVGLAFVLLGGAAVLWWTSTHGLDDAPTDALEGGGALAPGPSTGGTGGPTLLGTESEAVGLDEGDTRATVADVVGDEAVERLGTGKGKAYGVPTDAVWAEGRIQLPEGTPADESPVVIAKGRKFETRKGEPDEYLAEVAPDGSFRVAFAKKTRRGKLTVEGRYVFLENPYVFNPHAPEEEVVLAPALGGRIEVEVLPPGAQSFDEGVLDGLVVEALAGRWSQHPKLDGVQVAEGRYELGGAKPSVGYDVYGKSPAFADGKLENVRVEPGQSTYVQVALTFGARLFGEVVDEQGQPVEHAKVLAMTKQEAAQRNPFINRTVDTVAESGDGSYDIRGVVPGELVLVVEADGYLEKQYDVGEMFDGEERSARITLDRGGVIRGVVQWPGGSPAIGAEVRLSQESTFGGGRMGGLDMEQQMGRIQVGASGEFEFSALKSGTCSVTASAVERGFKLPPDASLRERKFGTKPMWRAHQDGVKPGAVLTLELAPGSNLVGIVVDDSGEPVRNFQVTATPDGTDMLNTRSIKPIRERFKSEKGEFLLGGVQDGRWKVKARSIGYATCKEVTITAPYDGELRLTLPRSGEVSGVVLAPTGKPIENARVRVTHGDGRDASAESDRKGEFRVSRLEPGALSITATADGFASALPLEIDMSADGAREGLTLNLRTGGALLCEVHEAAAPRENRQVSLRGQGWNNGRTDDSGRVEFKGLEPGTYTVELEAAEQEGGDRRTNWMRSFTNKKSVEVEVRDGETRRVVLGQPSADAVTVRGRVLDDGEPVAEANVAVFAIGAGDDPSGGDVTEADGAYEILLDGPGEYRFVVGRDWGSQSTFMETVPAGATYTLDFELPGGKVTGVVRGVGEPVEGASVTLTPVVDGQEQGSGRWFGRRQAGTAIDGEFTFEDVADGTYNLRVQANERLENGGRLGAVLVEGVTVADGAQASPLEIELPLAGWVEGTVVNAAGEPVRRASINVTSEDGEQITQFSRTRSGSDGRFEYQGISPGTVLVTASVSGRTSPAERVRVQSGAGSQVRLAIPD